MFCKSCCSAYIFDGNVFDISGYRSRRMNMNSRWRLKIASTIAIVMKFDIPLESLCFKTEDTLDLSAMEKNSLGEFLKIFVISK